MSKSKWELWKEKDMEDVAKPWDILNPKINKLSEEDSQKRLDICLQCDRLVKKINQCKECGCLMNLKTQLPHAYCPLGKWGAVNAVD